MSKLKELEEWYLFQGNGAWEREYGISITVVGNPGWSVEIDLKYTNLEDNEFKAFNYQRENEHDWIIRAVEDSKFLGDGSAEKPKDYGRNATVEGACLNRLLDKKNTLANARVSALLGIELSAIYRMLPTRRILQFIRTNQPEVNLN
ncbi:MAG: Imm53 family immunity protein [Pyrinomonadaceae bacterium]